MVAIEDKRAATQKHQHGALGKVFGLPAADTTGCTVCAREEREREVRVSEYARALDEKPTCTAVIFAYDERPCINLVRSILRDLPGWPGLHVWDQSKDALIARTRSIAATRFLEQGVGDVLVMLDHDIGWDAGDLERIVRQCEQTRGIIGGVYSIREFGRGTAAVRLPDGDSYAMGSDRLVECEAVGTGFFAVHRDVLEAMVRDGLAMNVQGWWPFFKFGERVNAAGETDFLSEDWWFCEEARRLGFSVHADLQPNLTHWGTHHFAMIDTAAKLSPRNQRVTLNVVGSDDVIEFEDGRRMVIDGSDRVVSTAIMREKQWEPEVTEEIIKASSDAGWFLELGAHIGYHTLVAARHYATVLAVEPMPRALGILRRNLDLNDVDNVTVMGVAVGDADRPARMRRDYDNPGASHLVPDDSLQGVPVEMVTLSTLLERQPFEPTVMKLDLEGAEYLALRGGIPDSVKVIIFEYSEDQLRNVSGVLGSVLTDFLEGYGFRLRFAGTDTLVTAELLPGDGSYVNLVGERE